MNVVNKEKNTVAVRDTETGAVYFLQPGNNEFNEEVAHRLVKHQPNYEGYPELRQAHQPTQRPADAPEKVVLGDTPEDKGGNLDDAI